jgi:hypothetical protein
VEDVVRAIDQRREHGTVHDRVDRQLEGRAGLQVLDVAVLARREVVEGEDAMAVHQQLLGEVSADESRTSGDQIRLRHRDSFGDRTRAVWPLGPGRDCFGNLTASLLRKWLKRKTLGIREAGRS